MEDNHLTVVTGQGLTTLVSGGAIGEIIKPLTREIHLFDSFVAGTTHLKDATALEEAVEGAKLTLRREENRYDDNAILLLAPSGKKLGYVPEKDNVVFARLMDAGKLLSATVKAVERKGSFTQIRIGIYLIDF